MTPRGVVLFRHPGPSTVHGPSRYCLDQILRAEGYQIVTRVVKDRSEVKSGECTYALDNVKGLGVFLEIEIITKDTSAVGAAEVKIKSIAAELGLDDDMIETEKYDRLISEKP